MCRILGGGSRLTRPPLGLRSNPRSLSHRNANLNSIAGNLYMPRATPTATYLETYCGRFVGPETSVMKAQEGYTFITCPFLAQGSKPPIGSVTKNCFDVLILTAIEYQPKSFSFPGIRVFHAPFDDGLIDSYTLRTATSSAHFVANCIQYGKRVLVTCNQGRNRSGLVTALALVQLGIPPRKAIQKIRQARGSDALSNPYFVKAILANPMQISY